MAAAVAGKPANPAAAAAAASQEPAGAAAPSVDGDQATEAGPTTPTPADRIKQSSKHAWGVLKNAFQATAKLGRGTTADAEAGEGVAAATAADVSAGEAEGLLPGASPAAAEPATPSRLGALKGMFSNSIKSIKSKVGRGEGQADAAAEEDGYCGLSRVQRIQAFVVLLFAGGVLLSVAFFIFFPVVVLMPSKFALSFSMGSLCIMGAFGAYNGPRTFIKGLLARDRLGFTAAYVFSILFTLYASLMVGSYILVMLASAGQIAALMWYTATFFPYGRTGMKLLTKFCATGCSKVCWPCVTGMGRLCARG